MCSDIANHQYASLVVESCVFENNGNTNTYTGGGIMAGIGYEIVYVKDTLFKNNKARHGGAIKFWGSAQSVWRSGSGM